MRWDEDDPYAMFRGPGSITFVTRTLIPALVLFAAFIALLVMFV